jgi:hypothetical protein
MRRIVGGAGVAAGIACLASVVAAAQAPSLPRALRGVEREIARFECETAGVDVIRLMAKGRGREGDSTGVLVRARQRVEAHLRDHDDDAAAWVLLARIGRIAGGCGSWSATMTDTGPAWTDPPLDPAPLHAALDRALALRPDYAEAHYWKALIHHAGRPAVRDGDLEPEIDYAQTLHHAARAVELDAHNDRYRAFWGGVLVETGRATEALSALRPIAGGAHPLYLVLRDFAALPLPAGAVIWPDSVHNPKHPASPEWAARLLLGASFMASEIGGQAERRLSRTVAPGRMRGWVVPVSKDSLEAFYRRTWPAFRLFRAATDSTMSLWTQELRFDRAGRPQPADRDAGFLTGNGPTPEGLFLLVGEGARIEQPPAVADMPVQALIVVVNFRRPR